MTCDGHVRGNFNDYFSWNNGMCSQLILRANSLKYVPQLFFMLTCSSANAMQCSVKIVSELFLGHQLISFDKIFSLRKNRMQDKLCWHEQEKFALMQDNYLSSTYRFNLRIVESDFFFYKMSAQSKKRGWGGGIIISFLYNNRGYSFIIHICLLYVIVLGASFVSLGLWFLH